jgi:hypothetical protein
LGCAQNQAAPPKCKSEDGAGSTTTCSTPNDFGSSAQHREMWRVWLVFCGDSITRDCLRCIYTTEMKSAPRKYRGEMEGRIFAFECKGFDIRFSSDVEKVVNLKGRLFE